MAAAICIFTILLSLWLSPVVVQGTTFVQPGPPDSCLQGPYHKNTPSREEEEFRECLSWQNSSCCNVALSASISQHNAVQLYNYSWDLCGVLSPECEEFIKDEECFYQCEPMLGHFEIDMTGYIQGVPVCAEYCDAWFNACEGETTCVENWLEDFDFAEDGTNTCPNNTSCITFQEMYGSSRGLCNRMWGNAFYYETNTTNCTVMRFNSTQPNPNFQLTFPGGAPVLEWSTSLLLLWAGLAMLL